MREMFPPNRIFDKPIVVVLRVREGRFGQRRNPLERLTDMHRSARILLFLQLASTVLPALDFDGQVGRLDEAQLGMDWWRLGPGEFPILPLEGVRVSVLDCGEDCPDPVRTDPAGWFRFPDLASPARLRFDLRSATLPIRSASPWSRVKWNAHPGPARPLAQSGLRGSRTPCCVTCRR